MKKAIFIVLITVTSLIAQEPPRKDTYTQLLHEANQSLKLGKKTHAQLLYKRVFQESHDPAQKGKAAMRLTKIFIESHNPLEIEANSYASDVPYLEHAHLLTELSDKEQLITAYLLGKHYFDTNNNKKEASRYFFKAIQHTFDDELKPLEHSLEDYILSIGKALYDEKPTASETSGPFHVLFSHGTPRSKAMGAFYLGLITFKAFQEKRHPYDLNQAKHFFSFVVKHKDDIDTPFYSKALLYLGHANIDSQNLNDAILQLKEALSIPNLSTQLQAATLLIYIANSLFTGAQISGALNEYEIAQDIPEALELYQLLFNQNANKFAKATAAIQLGGYYLPGLHAQPNHIRARQYLTYAAQQNDNLAAKQRATILLNIIARPLRDITPARRSIYRRPFKRQGPWN